MSDHGLAVVCRNEALVALVSLFDNPGTPILGAIAHEPLAPDARTFLSHCDGRTKVAMLLPAGIARVRTLRALHDLMRMGLVHVGRPVSAIEGAHTLPAPPK